MSRLEEMAAPHNTHLLVVDDERFILNALRLYFESNNFRVSTASKGEEALQIFRNDADPVDVVILDLVMPGNHGLELLRTFKDLDPNVQVIIATGCGSMGSAIEALRLGACDFITKPFLDFDKDLMSSVKSALEVRRRLAPPPQASAPPQPGRQWLEVYERLNDFADAYAGKPPDPTVMRSVWTLLVEGFGVDDAALVVQEPEHWTPVHVWGCFSSDETEVLVFDDLLDALPRPVDSADVDLAGAFNTAAASLRASAALGGGSRSLWSKVLQVPLFSSSERARRLLLFYRAGNPLEPEAGPLALLGTVLGPILIHLRPRNRKEAPPWPPDTKCVPEGGRAAT